ncbi:MAG: hypothetical protein IT285_11340 [Bdellovibrionales bacterium]|nr:hypothetical protein [Bdellovibrionales bacterium]
MTFSSLFPVLFAAIMVTLAGGAALALAIGARKPASAGWSVSVLLFGLAVLATIAIVLEFEGAPALLSGSSAWVDPGGDVRSMRLGLNGRGAAWIWILVTSATTLAFMVSLDLHSNDRAAHRIYAAAALGVAGCALAWLSYSAWSGLFANGILVVAGTILLGTHSGGSNEDAHFAFRYAFERFSAVLIALTGVLALAWDGVELAATAVPAQESKGAFPGGWLLCIGAYLMVRPFPFLGWSGAKSRSRSGARILVSELLPAVGAYGLLHYAEPKLRALGVFPGFGAAAIAGALLTGLCGVFQREPSRAYSCWLSAIYCTGFAALAWAGPAVSDALLLGATLGFSAFLLAIGEPERGVGTWATPTGMVALGGAVVATGMFGFLSAAGHFGMLSEAANTPWRLAVVAANFLLLTYFFWKTAWETACPDRTRKHGVWAVVPSVILTLAGLCVIWMGSFSGGVLPGESDRLGRSLLEWASAAPPGAPPSGSADWILGGGLVVGLVSSLWSRAAWQKWSKTPPRVGRFLASGYGVDTAGAAVFRMIVAFGKLSERTLAIQLWSEGVVKLSWAGIQYAARITLRVDTGADRIVARSARRLIHAPAKLLQVVQSGDFQWYLLFAALVGGAILVHYLRVSS